MRIREALRLFMELGIALWFLFIEFSVAESLEPVVNWANGLLHDGATEDISLEPFEPWIRAGVFLIAAVYIGILRYRNWALRKQPQGDPLSAVKRHMADLVAEYHRTEESNIRRYEDHNDRLPGDWTKRAIAFVRGNLVATYTQELDSHEFWSQFLGAVRVVGGAAVTSVDSAAFAAGVAERLRAWRGDLTEGDLLPSAPVPPQLQGTSDQELLDHVERLFRADPPTDSP